MQEVNTDYMHSKLPCQVQEVNTDYMHSKFPCQVQEVNTDYICIASSRVKCNADKIVQVVFIDK